MSTAHTARLALPPAQAAEIVVRTVLSHSLIEVSSMTDQQVAAAVARAILTPDEQSAG